MTSNSHKDGMKVDSARQKPSKGGWNAAIFLFRKNTSPLIDRALCSSFNFFNFHFLLLAVVEVVERFAFFGLAANLITYLTNELHQPTSTAAKNVNIWSGVSYIVPLFAAFVADSLLGRFNTIFLASVIYLVVSYMQVFNKYNI